MGTFLRVAKQFALPNWYWYLSGIIALALTTWITVTIPKLSKDLVNHIQSGVVSDSLSGLAGLIVVLGLLQMVVRALSRIFFFWPGRKLEYDLRNHLFSRMTRFSMGFYQKNLLGDLISRLANDVTHLRIFFAFALLQMCNFLFLLGFAIFQMYTVNASLTYVALGPLLCMLVTTRIGMPYLHKYAQISQESVAQLTNVVTEALVNVLAIKSANASDAFEKRVATRNHELFIANIKLTLIRNIIFPLSSLLTGMSYLAVLLYGGRLIIADKLTIGDLLAFNMYIALLAFPLTALGIIMSVYQRAKVAADRLSIIEEEPFEVSGEAHLDWTFPTTIQISNLSFSYNQSQRDRPVINQLSLDIHRGEVVGIVGPIAAGKSTLLALLAGLYQPESGSIRICGRDIVDLDKDSYRNQIGVAYQVPFLFSADVEQNILYGSDQNTDAALQAATFAQIDDDIEMLSHGWHTQVGETGVRLSGGQKQRLALARLFLKKPKLWLLDDTLSAIDELTQRNIMTELHNIKATMIVVSHRPETLIDCDRIVIMEDGRIIYDGDYDGGYQKYPDFFLGDV